MSSNHLSSNRFGEHEGRYEVDLENAAKLLGSSLCSRGNATDPGVVHQQIDWSQLTLNPAGQVCHRVFVRNVALKIQRGQTFFAEPTSNLTGRSQVRQRDGIAIFGKQLSGSPPDSLCSPGDDRCLVRVVHPVLFTRQ